MRVFPPENVVLTLTVPLIPFTTKDPCILNAEVPTKAPPNDTLLVPFVKPILLKAAFVSVNIPIVTATEVITILKLINHVPVTGIVNVAKAVVLLDNVPCVHPVEGEFTINPICPEVEGAAPNV